ncbi:DUF3221 domain-containing protein [Piscibacillus salipiscarius]|uniref:DUF3221 domain-containing protein n=1 Tax=Piscibacillus salipiscarius TaxID=299480 RepID=A0ABW5QD06_9BACI|nr:DUF3221 domain-containing protein [Piscibacillus salipiscarius]
MKTISSLMFILALFLPACSEITNEELDPHQSNVFDGHIIEIKGSRVLVVAGLTKDEATSMNEASLLEVENPPDAVWFEVDSGSQYDVGDHIRVRYDGMDASYPGQAEAEKVQIVQ